MEVSDVSYGYAPVYSWPGKDLPVTRENIRVYSKRTAPGDPIVDGAILQRTINRLRGTGVAPRGVFRFQSHEEAERWQIRQLAALHARRSSKTLSSSADG